MKVGLAMIGRGLEGGGGAERRFFRVWKHLRAQREDHVLLVNRALLESAINAGVLAAADRHGQIVVLPEYGGGSVSSALLRALRRQKIDVLHLPLAHRRLVPFYMRLALEGGIGIAHTVALSALAYATRVPLSTLWVSRGLWRLAHAIDALYPAFRENVAVPRGFASKVRVTPCSFSDPQQFAPASDKSATIVFAGRLIPEKQPLLFVDALQRLRSSGGSPWRAVIAGRGPLRQDVQGAVARLGLTSEVEVIEEVNLATVLAHSRVFVSLQMTENYPSQSLLEAMLCENAVVATDVGDTRRLVRDGETGVLVHPDPGRVADAISSLIETPRRAAALGRSARAFVQREHTIGRFIGHLREVWELARATV